MNGVVNPAYTYDANNNMTAGAGRTVTYTSFNMAASIVQGSTYASGEGHGVVWSGREVSASGSFGRDGARFQFQGSSSGCAWLG